MKSALTHVLSKTTVLAGAVAVAAGLSAVSVQRTTQRAHYADFKSLLRAVKAVGANQVGDGRRTVEIVTEPLQSART